MMECRFQACSWRLEKGALLRLLRINLLNATTVRHQLLLFFHSAAVREPNTLLR